MTETLNTDHEFDNGESLGIISRSVLSSDYLLRLTYR